MKEYQQNKKKYTARSVKGIYRFQGFYFGGLIGKLGETLGRFTEEEIRYVTEVVGSFPVKKREHRIGVVGVLAGELVKRGAGLLEK